MRRLSLLAIPVLTVLLSGCGSLKIITEIGTSVAVATGTMTTEQAQSINKSVESVSKSFEELTPENEYYIGRSVSSLVLSRYKPYDNSRVNSYLNLLGQSLAKFSDQPDTFGGYHFLALDTEEVNAFAAPGGFILVSRGLLRCCKNEDALAAVLAHEIGHIQNKHGLKAIKTSRWTSTMTVLAAESVKSFAGQELAQLTETFEGSLDDIMQTMVNSGYSRKSETQADISAVEIMKRAGYNPDGLRQMLLEMDGRMKPTEAGFAKTHPDPKTRINDVENLLRDCAQVVVIKPRQARFEKNLDGI